MNNQMKYLGRKIKELSGDVAGFLNLPRDGNQYSAIYSKLDNKRYMQGYLYYLVGEYLAEQSPTIKADLFSFANLLGRKSVGGSGSLDTSIGLLNETRTAVFDLFEKEIETGSITPGDFFECMKILDPLYHAVLSSVVTHYNDILSTTRYALDESAEGLKVTLNELAELKKALNEATIFSVMDENDRFIYVNKKYCEVTKYTPEELIGKTPAMLYSGYHPMEYFDELWEEVSAGKVWNGEILNRAKDGTTFWVDTTIVPFLDRNGKKYKHISIQYDITEKKRTEETLQKAEKLSMVGELAAGFAHEIRNPLTTIKGFVQLLTETTNETVFTKTILDEIDRINSIVSDFMIFARPHQADYSKCNLAAILQGAARFLEPEALLRNVIIISHFPRDEVLISGEKNQLKQVFLNILKNAIEAIPNGGIVTISIEERAKEVAVIIEDTGIGMTDEQLKKLGEPFFTTKATGNGLGLMVSYKIIQDHKGRINVESEGPNKGTAFIITFPYKN
ncbi:ATP-binding protein [Bacillus sp. FJAT-27245]|uniref:ATP-binding protein n=1 Tax=Bacillus sp. FJAT-27245 TaxID=1684144 RepID=UPI0006A7C162|nr:ATP-binding protein [Bacillus sp. FJAT-27245]